MDNIKEKIYSFDQNGINNESNIESKTESNIESKTNNDINDQDGNINDQEGNINDQDGNLSNNKVNTEIEPTTTGNNVNVSLCSCIFVASCLIS